MIESHLALTEDTLSRITDGSPITSQRWFRFLAIASFSALFFNNVVKSIEIRALTKSVELWRRRAQWPTAGVQFPPMATNTLRGDARVVGARSLKTQIIAVLTTSCPNCRASIPQWKRLSRLVDTLATEMVWLSLSPHDSTLAYVNEHGLPQEQVAENPDRTLVLAARMRGVPLALVVDTGGVIRHVSAGQLTAPQADSVLLVARTLRATRASATLRSAQPVAFRSKTRAPVP